MSSISLKSFAVFCVLVICVLTNLFLSFIAWAPGDLDCFIASGSALASGHNPYTAYAPHFSTAEKPAFNFNPPPVTILFVFLAGTDLMQVYPYWKAVSVLLYICAICLLVWFYRPSFLKIIWVFALSGFSTTLATGQIYMPLVLAVTVAYIFLDKRNDWAAAFFIAIVIVAKPNFAIWPIFLFLAGSRKVFWLSVLFSAFFAAIPLTIYGPSIYFNWLPIASSVVADANNISLFGIALRIGADWLRWPLFFLTIAIPAIWIYRTKPPLKTVSGIALIVSMLASPLAWESYTLFLLPAFLSSEWTRLVRISAIALMFPAGLIQISQVLFPVGATVSSFIYPTGLVAMLFSCLTIKKQEIHSDSAVSELSSRGAVRMD